MIRSAPATFLAALTGLIAAIWWLISQLYASRFDGQKEAISALEGRVKAKEDDLARKSAQILDLEKKSGASSQHDIPRDPNGIYQLGVKLGTAYGASRNIGVSQVNFTLLDASGDFDASVDFEYQELVLRIVGGPGTIATSGGMGIVDRRRLGEVSCRIVSRRE